jgi:sigma-B regulation protein RsbU (phosphoserine phosphatase)
MEEKIISSQIPYIEELARAWLESGADSYEVWTNNTRVAHWSKNGFRKTNTLSAEIRVDSTPIGELRLSGLISPTAKSRLNAEANLISNHACLGRDLNDLTKELLNTRDQLLAVFNLTKANRNNHDLDQAIDDLAFEATRLLKAVGAFFYLVMQDGTTHIHQFPVQLLEGDEIDLLLTRFEKVGDQYLCINDGEIELFYPVRNLLLMPIPIRGTTQAVFGIINKEGSQYLTSDIKLSRAIADYAGSHIENLLLLQMSVEHAKLHAEMELAQEIQNRFLPTNTPKISDLDVWAASRPASQVGGDFYDFFSDSNGAFTFFIGDVSGKGMPAALLVSMTQAALKSEFNLKNGYSPHSILDSSNQKLYEDFNRVGMFATVFIGRYDADTHQLCFGNAGHSPVVYIPAEEEGYLLKADSMPIGIMSTRDSEDQCLDVRIGDVVLIGTDGLVDAQNPDKMRYGYDRFQKIVESLAKKTSREIGEGLISDVDEFTAGGFQGDDQTLVVLKRIK